MQLVYTYMSWRILSISINTHNDGDHGDARFRFFEGRSFLEVLQLGVADL